MIARRNALAVASALALAACGTTVPTTRQAAPSQELGGVSSGTTTSLPTSGPSGVTPEAGSAAGGTAAARNGGAGGDGVPVAGGAPTAVAGPGAALAGGTLLVGVPYIDQQQSSAFTAGISSGLETGDPKANYQFLVDDLNKQGGILGRKVAIVFHRVDPTESQVQYEQETCTDFAQDHRVPFVLGGLPPTLAKCLIDKGVGVLGEGGQVNTRDYERMRYFVQPGSIALDRLARLQASEFTRMGLFKGTVPARVGILYYDVPAYRYAESVLVGELKKRGIQVAAEEAFHQPGSTQDVGQTEGQVQAAVLKFKAEGVTHVVAVELNAWLQGFFALYSSQQDYYPRYGWTSNQVPTNAQAAVPHKELVGSLVLGFYPTYDTEKQSDYPPATRRCLAQLSAHGVAFTSGNQRADAVTACDAVHYLKAALTAGGGVTRDALVAGARVLGHSYVPSSTYASFLPLGFGAGIAAMRPGAWSTECDCFTYTGKPFAVS